MSKCSECGGRCELGMTDTYVTNNGVLHAITECVKNLKSQLTQAREEIEELKSINLEVVRSDAEARKERDDLKAKLSKAEEEMATIKHDLRLTQDAHIEALGERDQARGEIESYKECVNGHKNPKWTCVSCGSETMEALQAKLSKLERVRVALKNLLASPSALQSANKEILAAEYELRKEARAALRETEER